MIAAVANLSLARGTAYDVSLVVQDAAGVPLNLSAAELAATLKTGEAVTSLDMTMADAGAVLVHIPPQDQGMKSWEIWLQASAETPRERILSGLVTVAERIDPRDGGNPSTHRMIVRLADAVTVSIDSVDLAWWAYEQTRKLLGVDYATLCAASAQSAADSASQAGRDAAAAHTSSVNAATYSTEALRHKDAAGLSASAAGTSERNASGSAQAAGVSAQSAADSASQAGRDAAAAHTSSVNAATYSTEALRHKDAASLSASAAGTSERNASGSAQAAGVSAQDAADAATDARSISQAMTPILFSDLSLIPKNSTAWGMYGWCHAIADAAGGKNKPVQVIIPATLCAGLLAQLKITEMKEEESKACFRGAIMDDHFSGELVVQGIMTDAYSSPQFFRSYQITYSKGGYIWTTPSSGPYFNFDGDFSGITITKNLFRSELYLDEVYGIMPDVTDATMMCISSSIKEWHVDLPSLVVAGSGMTGIFERCQRLKKFTGALPMLEKGNAHNTGRAGMFSRCSALTDFQSQLPVLFDGRSMFQACSSLSSWSIPLPLLSLGSQMFYATSLAEWTVPLPSLKDGKDMFNGCRNLSAFDSAIPVLKDAGGMFLNCGLDVEAIDSILARLPVYEDGTDHTITFTGCPGAAECNATIGTAKGWTVEI